MYKFVTIVIPLRMSTNTTLSMTSSTTISIKSNVGVNQELSTPPKISCLLVQFFDLLGNDHLDCQIKGERSSLFLWEFTKEFVKGRKAID
jgi:hypothetical protein